MFWESPKKWQKEALWRCLVFEGLAIEAGRIWVWIPITHTKAGQQHLWPQHCDTGSEKQGTSGFHWPGFFVYSLSLHPHTWLWTVLAQLAMRHAGIFSILSSSFPLFRCLLPLLCYELSSHLYFAEVSRERGKTTVMGIIFLSWWLNSLGLLSGDQEKYPKERKTLQNAATQK